LNYASRFDAELHADAWPDVNPGAHLHSESVSGHIPADAITVSDAALLFQGAFKRSGVDLILSKDGHELVLQDYFRGEKRAALSSPDGAHLTGDIVNALTGHVQYSQADGDASAGQVIGHVTKLAGSATAIRNGVSITLNMGDNVEKGDVVQSGSDSTLGITFIDGTVFGLSSNARMVLNEMVYDPNGSNNSSLLSLVAGTISFVAGETAKHGDMKIDTPVATMGIRGTAVLVEIDFDIPAATQPGAPQAPSAKFQVLVEPDGTTGSYVLLDKTTLAPIATVNQAGTATIVSGGNVNFLASAPLSSELQKLINDVFTLKFTDNTDPNTKTANHHTDAPVPDALSPLKLANGATAIPTVLLVNGGDKGVSFGSGATLGFFDHIDGPPAVAIIDVSGKPTTGFLVLGGTVKTGNGAGVDTATGKINFADVNAGDRPTATVTFASFTYQNAQHQDVTQTLTAQQIADIQAVEAKIALAPDPANNNVGSVTWSYSVPDKALDFIAAGEVLTLTYVVRVDNNFAPNDEAAFKSFTITIEHASSEEAWINPGDGLWRVGANWETGAAPTANDDVIIPDEQIVGGTGHSVVTIDAETAAFAKSVTLNAENTTGAKLINDSTLTIGGTLTLFTDGELDNFGAVQVGALQLLDHSSLRNSGVLTIANGGELEDTSTVNNFEGGKIDLVGGTLTNEAAINNGGLITVETGATLLLADSSSVSGGQISNIGELDLQGTSFLKNGVLNNSGQVNVSGNDAFDGETVNNLSDGAVNVTGNLTFNAAIIDGGTINDSGIVDVTGSSTLENDALLNNGKVTVESGQTLILNDAIIAGSTVNDFGTVDVTGSSTLESGALLNNGKVTVESGQTLILNDATIAGSTVNDFGAVDVTGSSTLESGAILNNGKVTVESGQTLTLDGTTAGGITIDSNITLLKGSTLLLEGAVHNSGTVLVDAVTTETGATLAVAGHVTLDGSGVVTLDGVNDSIAGSSSAALLENVNNTINGFGDLGGHQFSLQNDVNGTIAATDATHQLVIDTGAGTFINHGSLFSDGAGGLEVEGSLTSDGLLEANAGLLKIDGGFSQGEGGQARIEGGNLEFGGSSNATVTFSGSTAGKLILDDAAHFTGTVGGFSLGDTIDLKGIDPTQVHLNGDGSLKVDFGTGSFALAGNNDPDDFTVTTDGQGGTDIISNREGPVIETDQFSVVQNANGSTAISGLQVNEIDSDDALFTATTSAASGSAVSPASSGPASLDGLNAALNAIIYTPNSSAPLTDKVMLTVTDSFGATDAVNFIFNEAGSNSNTVLQGTAGKDVIFATGHDDTLTGGGGQDQFVFKPNLGTTAAQHTVTDFAAGLDHLDLRQFGNIGSVNDLQESQQGNDTLIKLDNLDNVLLKNVALANLHASDFIFHT
jgi:hypothetical protein